MRGIILHHTVTANHATVADIDKMHKARGFLGVGYHYLVRYDPDLETWHYQVGRDVHELGAHCHGKNDWIGVAVAGNYHLHELPDGARYVLVELLAELCATHDIEPQYIHEHRLYANTLCPGRYIVGELPSIRAGLNAILP